jgi:hypothetical protein
VGVGVCAVIVISPLVYWGDNVFRVVSTNSKSSGEPVQTRLLISPGVLLTLSIRKLKSVPYPEIGVLTSFTKALTRTVLNGPAPGRMFPATVHPGTVSPAGLTTGAMKVTTLSSKVKSPWKLIRFRLGSMLW